MNALTLQSSLASIFGYVASANVPYLGAIGSPRGIEFLKDAAPRELSRALLTAQLLGARIPDDVARLARSSASHASQADTVMSQHLREAWWQAQAVLGGGWRVFEISDHNIRFIPESGGFPQIVHGGVSTYAGLVALGLRASSLRFDTLHQPTRISGRLAAKIVPGSSYSFETKSDSEGSSVSLGGNSATVTAAPLDEERPDGMPAYSPEILAQSSHIEHFHCIPSCIAFGADNPHGLHLEGHFLAADVNASPSLVFGLWPEGVPSLLPLIMASDELSFWMIAAWTGRMGVTPEIEMEWWRHPAPREPVAVAVIPPSGKRKARLVDGSSYVVAEGGEVLARSTVTFFADSRSVQEGMAGTETATLLPIMKRFGLSV